MDASSQDQPLSESKECVVNNSENVPFVLGTGKLVTPQKHVAVSNLCTPDTFKSPLDFSTITVEQLGITPESFVKTPSGKSPSSLQKTRRRSAVGVRGSPETNCLIRFIAQQRNLKNAERSPLALKSPFQGSPRPYRNASALRERMAAFRSAFQSIKETEKMAGGPANSKADQESKTSDLTKKEGLVEYQQSGFPVNSSSKRRRISSQSSPDDHLSLAKEKVVCAQALTSQECTVGTSADLAEKSSDIGSAQSGCIVAPLPEVMEVSHGLGVADCVQGRRPVDAVPLDTSAAQVSSDTAPAIRSPVTPECRSSGPSSKTFVLRSVLKKPGKLFPEDSKENLCDGGAHLIPDPSNYCKEQRTDRDNCKAPGFLSLKKRKRVTFGEDLSPEVFDESLPANTPLCKGGTPARQRNVNAASPLLLEQSSVHEQLLEQSSVHEQLVQPNFDDEENLENIEPPQVSFAILSPSKSSLSETLPGTGTCSPLNNHEEIACGVGRATRTSHRRKQVMSSASGEVCNSYARGPKPCKEKNMNRRKPQERKCTNRALSKKKQVLKNCRKKRKGKKNVEKCLYGEREIASKKPLLSPIAELPEVSDMTPLADCTRRMCSDDFNVSAEVEEVISLEIPVKRKRRLPQVEDLCELDPAFDQSHVSELCCCLLPFTAASEGGPDANTRDTGSEGNARAESTCQSAEEPETEAKTESTPVPCTSVPQGHFVSDNPEPLCSPQCQEFSKAGGNAENPCEILPVSENTNVKYEEESECSAVKGSLQCSPFTSDSEKEHNCSEDVLVKNIKESTSHSESVGRKPAENSNIVSGRERKQRRDSVYYCEGQSSYLEQNGNPTSSHSGGNSVDISLENSQMIKDLSDAIEQSFERTSSKTKVRRSTRLRRDLENTGLVWMLPPSAPTSQKTKRRKTICSFDSRRFESMSPKEETTSSGQKPDALPLVPDRESSESQGVGSSTLPVKKRKSFCVSAPTNTEGTTQPPNCKRRPSLPSLKKGESSQLP